MCQALSWYGQGSEAEREECAGRRHALSTAATCSHRTDIGHWARRLMRLPGLVTAKWHIGSAVSAGRGADYRRLAVTVWWDWSGVEGMFAFALSHGVDAVAAVVTVVVHWE